MGKIKEVAMYLCHPLKMIVKCASKGWFYMPDKLYLRIVLQSKMNYRIDLDKPRSFNEKLQWLKLHDRKPEYVQMVDKYEVKKYVATKIGKQYIIPTLGIWDKVESICFNELPDQFVLKCTHDSGSTTICKEKRMFDENTAKKKYKRILRRNFFYIGREWPYKEVKPRIIAEKFMVDRLDNEIKDYKVMCFNGVPKLIQVHQGRFGRHTQDYYDIHWELTDYEQIGTPRSGVCLEKPVFLDEMLRLSEELSCGIPHVRVDWYFCNEQLYFGELTFFDSSGFDRYMSDEQDFQLGKLLDITN